MNRSALKKLLVFLVLFGAGLSVLLYFVRQGEKPAPPPRRETEAKPTNFTELPVQGDGKSTQRFGVVLDGALDFTAREDKPRAGEEADVRRPLFSVHADDVDALGNDVYDAKKLVILFFEPATRAVRFELKSPKSQLHLPITPDGQPALESGETVRLDNVEMTLHDGAPIVPLTLSVPHLEWRLTKEQIVERFHSNDHVQLDGKGFAAEGTGLDASTTDGVLELKRSGIVRLRLENGADATLTATGTGPIRVVRKQIDDADVLEITTTDGARLEVSEVTRPPEPGRRESERSGPVELTARTLELVGRRGAGADSEFRVVSAKARDDVVAHSGGDTFKAHHAEFTFTAANRFDRAVLDGEVVLESAGDTFRGDVAEFDFDSEGHIARARVTGTPSGTLQLAKYLPSRPVAGELDRELRAASARVVGAGPLVVEFGAEKKLELTGPGRIEVPEMGFTLSAQTSLAGSVAAGGKSGKLVARGSVVGTYETSEITSDVIDLSFVMNEPGKEAVVVVTSGPTRVTSQPPGRDKFVLDARTGIEARTAGGAVSIPVAREVAIKAEGPKGFDARADLVHDLDWDARSFIAEGNVLFSNAEGDGNAERAVARGGEEIELYGTAADPARWTLARRATKKGPLEAEARAREIHASKDKLRASGAVDARVSAGVDEHHFKSDELTLELDPPADPARPDVRTYHARANGNVEAHFKAPDRDGTVHCRSLAIDGRATLPEDGQAPKLASEAAVLAEGDVVLELRGKGGLKGSGERFTYDEQRRGRLEARAGEQIHAAGTFGKAGLAYDMTATWLEFDDERVEASEVVVGLDPNALGALKPEEASATLVAMRTRHFTANTHEIVLEGDAHAEGRTGQLDKQEGDEAWSVDAGTLRIRGRFERERKLSRDDLQVIDATGGFKAVLGTRASAEGETMTGTPTRTRIEGKPAKLHLPGAQLESNWIEYDAEKLLLSSDKGVLQPEVAPGEEPWSVTYESLQPFARGENTILVLRNPLFSQAAKKGERQLRAGWALFWVDHAEWSKRGESAMREGTRGRGLHVSVPETDTPQPKSEKTLAQRFLELRKEPIAQVLSELYIEGNPELTLAGDRIMRATSIYIDLKEGRGWVRDADVVQNIKIRSQPQQIRARADWMSIGPDFTLRADKAVLTTCDYDDPHYVIETGDLRMKVGSESDFSITASKNSLRFGGAWAMPLPKFFFGQENGYPFIGELNLGDSARFGASVRTALNLPLGGFGIGIGSVFGKLLDLPDVKIPEGRWKLNAGILGTRGVLLGTGLEYLVKEEGADGKDGRTVFHFDASIDGIPDSREDRGFVRVDPDDRPLLRNWFRVRGRWAPEAHRWWDLALSIQSDPGVQSEFFERDYLEYEQKDNYLHYRSSWDDWYFYGSAKILLEDRTDIEELPTLGIARGRTPLTHLGELPVYYLSQTDVGYLQRRDGDPLYYPPFPDGLGDREVLRFDTLQRVEVPFDLGIAAVRATPFVEGRFTAWDRGVDDTEAPLRGAVIAGVELGTTFWRRFTNGSLHALSPTLSVRGDVVSEDAGGDPVRFDDVEDPIEGTFVDFTLHSRWWRPSSKQRFDVELTGTYGMDLPNGAPDELQPLAALAEFLTFAGEVPIGFTHDGRYDTETGNTVYSRTFVGCEPVRDWGIEMGYHLGRDASEAVLYEAATLGVRYRASQKWELEAQQSYSFTDESRLDNSFTLRRFGHDFVMEVDLRYRAGEGTSFNMNFKPLFAWKRSSLGLIDRWLGVYH